MRKVRVEDLLREVDKHLELQPVAGIGGLGRAILSSRIQRPAKELSQDPAQVGANRLIVFGTNEMEAMQRLTPQGRSRLFRELSFLDIPCIIAEGARCASEELRAFAQEHSIPLFISQSKGARLTRLLHSKLEKLLGPGLHIQGVLMHICSVGVLILGKSGIGKSECALDLITRGHALVADDLVALRMDGSKAVIGECPELTRNHMEVRGLGIINIRDLFGPEAVVFECAVELVVELLEWEQIKDMDRAGLSQRTFTVLEKELPLLRIPVSLNRNVAIILEVAVRNYLLRQRGIRPLERFVQRVDARLRDGASL